MMLLYVDVGSCNGLPQARYLIGTAGHCSALPCNVLYLTAPPCILLHCTVMHQNALC